MSDHEVSVEEEVATVIVSKPHVVVLGAGASLATCPNGDKNERRLPLMNDMVEHLKLREVIPDGIEGLPTNFEELYSVLHDRGDTKALEAIEQRVREHFESLELPYVPTIYDHLVLSLRETDIIASFNWDPLLLQAYRRNKARGLWLPKLAFLHGNVGIAYCAKDKLLSIAGVVCRHCGESLTPSPLLFPVSHKDYASNVVIADQWKLFKSGLSQAFMVTIFGYGGPRTDAEAIAAMKSGWGDVANREMEQTAFITRPGADENALRDHWKNFVHTHHYEVANDFYQSWIAKHPRRTGEAWWNQYFEAKFISNNPIPRSGGFEDLWQWYEQFRGAEEAKRVTKDAP